MHLIYNAFQDKLAYYLHTPLKSLILVSLDYARTKFIMKWLCFYCLFFWYSSSIQNHCIRNVWRIRSCLIFSGFLLSCCPAIQITSSGSRQSTYCPQYVWKWFPGLAFTLTLRLRWDWLSCAFSSSPSVPSFAKGCANCCLSLLLLLSLPSSRLQWPLFPMSGQWQCHAQLISSFHHSVNLIHTPLSSLSMSGAVQDSFCEEHPIPSPDPFSSWSMHNCWFIAHLCLKGKKKPKQIHISMEY